MNRKNPVRMMSIAILLISITAGFARADKLELQKKLSADIRIQLKDVTIGESLKKISEKAGVKFVLSGEAAWKLPYGEATRLSVALDGPLADSMTEMLNAFFMRYAVGSEEITIYPREELQHILGRPTAKQLELLQALYTQPIRTYYLDMEQATINKALEQEVLITPLYVHAQLSNLLRQLVGKNAITFELSKDRRTVIVTEKKPHQTEEEYIKGQGYDIPTPITIIQLLNQVIAKNSDESRHTTWYISGMDFPGQSPEIRILTTSEFASLKLDQKIEISYTDESLDKIFQDLANRAGVSLDVHPQSYLNKHKISVNMENISIGQAARNIAGMVGAECKTYRSIEISGQNIRSATTEPKPSPARATKTSRAAEDYVGKISIPMDDGKYYIEFMLREKDLTEELKKLRDDKMKELLGKEEEPQPKPTKGPTQPPRKSSNN